MTCPLAFCTNNKLKYTSHKFEYDCKGNYTFIVGDLNSL